MFCFPLHSQLCYAIVYGMGTKTLAKQLQVSEEEAALKHSSFLSSFPNVSAFITDSISSAGRLGYVTSLAGRKRFLPNIKSNDATLRGNLTNSQSCKKNCLPFWEVIGMFEHFLIF